MPAPISRPWISYALTFVSALLVGVSVVYWILGTTALLHSHVLAAPAMTAPQAPDTKDLARALGGKLPTPESAPLAPSTQYQLLGVVAGPVGKGYALLVVGSAAPKAYTVGSSLAEGMVLQSISARGARIGASLQGPVALELALPKPQGW